MIHKFKTKKQVKSALIAVNIIFATIFILLIILGMLVISPNKIQEAANLNQYKLYNINNLPRENSEIEFMQAAKIDKLQKDTENDANEEGEEQPPQQLVQKDKKSAKLAIIITNLGLNKYNTELAIDLPRQFSLGFLPYATNLKSLLDKAHNTGHEIFLYLPFASSADNENKYTLQTKLSSEENIHRLNLVLSVYNIYNGIYTDYKENFTDNKTAALPILDKLSEKNLIFILGKTNNLIKLPHLQNRPNIISPNVIIDAELDQESIEKNLKRLVDNAKKNKTALGYASNYTLTINILREWIEKFAQYGVDLVPVSELGETELSG